MEERKAKPSKRKAKSPPLQNSQKAKTDKKVKRNISADLEKSSNKRIEAKARTPSGNYLKSVQDIRTIFSPAKRSNNGKETVLKGQILNTPENSLAGSQVEQKQSGYRESVNRQR